MTERAKFGGFEFEFSSSGISGRGRPEPEAPFRIAVIGDFSGRANRGVCGGSDDLATRPVRLVDIDNIDERLAAMDVQVNIATADATGHAFAVPINELDAFHPDELHDRLEIFKGLRGTRRRLADNSTFAEAAAEVRAWAGDFGLPDAPPDDGSVAAPEAGGGDFSALLGGATNVSSATTSTSSHVATGIDLQGLLKDIVGPYVQPATDPQQAEYVHLVDQAISGQLRGIMSDPAFRQVEAAWRALHLLITTIETDETLQIAMIDVSADELAADVTAHERLEDTGLHRLLVDRTVKSPGTPPWSLLVVLHEFPMQREQAIVAARLAQVASAAGAPAVAAGDPRLAGCPDVTTTPDPREWKIDSNDPDWAAWNAVRSLPETASLVLTAPRVLLRLPYGAKTDPIDRIEFEEVTTPGATEQYLWGSGAVLVAILAAGAFTAEGWSLSSALSGDIGGLPVHTWKTAGGDAESLPCAEAWLTDVAGERLLDAGLTAVLSYRGRDAVLVPGVRSYAASDGSPAWRWT